MKSTVISLWLLLTCFTFAQANSTGDTLKIDDWLGVWEGELVMESRTKPAQTIAIRIEHFRTDTIGTYGWYLIYGDDREKGLRAYYLKEKEEVNHFVIDEKNGIYLDAYLIGNKMISDFEVQGSTITSIYTLNQDRSMAFEIIAGSSENVNISGGTEEIPEVLSYETNVYHHALLQKLNEEDK